MGSGGRSDDDDDGDDGAAVRELAVLGAELRVLAAQGAALARQRAVLTATTARLDAEAARLTRDLVSARAKLKAAEVKLGLGPTHPAHSNSATPPELRASAVLVGLRARYAALLDALPARPHLRAPRATLAPVHTLAGPEDSSGLAAAAAVAEAHVAGVVAARTCSTYPLVEDRSRRQGDPVCDRYRVEVARGRCVFALADGCNWGARAVAAARDAADAFVAHLCVAAGAPECPRACGAALLDAVCAAHNTVVAGRENVWDAGTTTLLGGAVYPIPVSSSSSSSSEASSSTDSDDEDSQDQGKDEEGAPQCYGVSLVSIGDCKAYLYSSAKHTVRELTFVPSILSSPYHTHTSSCATTASRQSSNRRATRASRAGGWGRLSTTGSRTCGTSRSSTRSATRTTCCCCARTACTRTSTLRASASRLPRSRPRLTASRGSRPLHATLRAARSPTPCSPRSASRTSSSASSRAWPPSHHRHRFLPLHHLQRQRQKQGRRRHTGRRCARCRRPRRSCAQ